MTPELDSIASTLARYVTCILYWVNNREQLSHTHKNKDLNPDLSIQLKALYPQDRQVLDHCITEIVGFPPLKNVLAKNYFDFLHTIFFILNF